MQVDAVEARLGERAGRPTALEVSAAGLLAASVILHLVALTPQYYGGAGQGSLWSEPDQAAQYVLLAAGWGLALGIALTGPARARLGAALAVGVAVTEFGFRLSDLGQVFRYGSGEAAAGLWLMTAAWAVGAAGAVLAVLAVRARAARPGPGEDRMADSSTARAASEVDEAVPPVAPGEARAGSDGPPVFSAPAPPEPRSSIPPVDGPESWEEWAPRDSSTGPLPVSADPPSSPAGPDATAPLGAGADPTGLWPAGSGTTAFPEVAPAPEPGVGAAPTILIGLLALATAGAFLPAWDHYVGVATTTGRTVSFNLGDAFTGPWQVYIGTVVVAVALVAVPLLATRMRNRAAGAAMVAGALIVLASQFVAALVQVDHPVPPSLAGLSASQANQLGLQLHLTLTGWFTVDLLAAFALFVAAMVLGYLREEQPTSVGSWAGAPYAPQTAGLPPA